jgi:peptidyl-prolyl cis-trans isomerase SurA
VAPASNGGSAVRVNKVTRQITVVGAEITERSHQVYENKGRAREKTEKRLGNGGAFSSGFGLVNFGQEARNSGTVSVTLGCGLAIPNRANSSLQRARRNQRVVATVGAFLATFVLGACRSHSAGQREIWAEVNGHPIYRDQVESYYRRRFPAEQQGVSREQALSLKLNLLNELVDNELLLERARKLAIAVPEAEVDHQIAELSSPYSSAEFQKTLSDEQLTPAALREQLRQNLLIEKLLRREITGRLAISAADVEAYYRDHLNQFRVPETRYHLAQILVTLGRDPSLHNPKQSDAVGRAEAERKVRMIEQELRSGQDFATLAAEYSEDPATVAGGGDMGFVPASSIASDAKLRLTVNAMRVGQLSGIVRDDKGDFHILKLLGREEAGQRPLSDPAVERTIRDTLTTEREQVLKAAYLEDLRNHAKVTDQLASQIMEAAGSPRP